MEVGSKNTKKCSGSELEEMKSTTEEIDSKENSK
jgi:hypothetical protein